MAAAGSPKRVVLRLYVAGDAPNSRRALVNVRAICAEHFANHHELEVIDMLEEPARAFMDGVIVTPTLVKLSPRPMRRVIGDLSNTSKVLETLGDV